MLLIAIRDVNFHVIFGALSLVLYSLVVSVVSDLELVFDTRLRVGEIVQNVLIGSWLNVKNIMT